MKVRIPNSHRELLAGPVNVVLTTLMPDGQPQTTPVWCNLDGDHVLINTMRQFRKAKNMRANPKVTLSGKLLLAAYSEFNLVIGLPASTGMWMWTGSCQPLRS